MKAVFLMRGWKKNFDDMVKWLETRHFQIPVWKNEKDYKAGKKPFKVGLLPGSLRPIQMFEFVFPENDKDQVLTSLGFDKEKGYLSKKQNLIIGRIRKMMGLKKAPKFKTNLIMPLPSEDMKDVSIIPIGIKEDEFRWFHDDKNFHEAL